MTSPKATETREQVVEKHVKEFGDETWVTTKEWERSLEKRMTSLYDKGYRAGIEKAIAIIKPMWGTQERDDLLAELRKLAEESQ